MVEHQIKDFNQLIENPEKVNEKELTYISKLTNKYPSSNFCFFMLTKILHYQKRIGYEKSLNSAALRFGKRTLLYDIIHSRKKILKNTTSRTDTTDSIELNNDLNELEKNIYGNLIQNQLIDEIELKPKEQNKIVIEANSTKEFMLFEEWLTGKQTKNTNTTTDIDSIIKNLNKRKIDKEKQDFYSGIKAAKNSLQENDDFNTETLAEIYVKQGNYPKAIKIYEQLMLSNPEKKLFFASRINYIKQKTQP